ncbi:MAG TPA: nickel pincer cofactor biosynthesis protein LarC [Gemmatimonadaceae bacterium]
MRVAIFDPFSGIAGDMALGALVQLGLEREWLMSLPGALGLDGVQVTIRDVRRGEISCVKVDFEIPPQPHGRHIHHIRSLVEKSDAPAKVKQLADRVFTAIATVEGEIHGVPIEKVHLHEVGSVDAILDIVGTIWGLDRLGVEAVFCGPIALGDGTVRAAHGILPVPAPATLKLLEGLSVSPGPDGSGELVTPTGAALVRILSRGGPPAAYVPRASGYGAGTKDFGDRANALRVILAETHAVAAVAGADGSVDSRESLVELVCDVDDMSPEYLAPIVERARDAGALDVVLLAETTKHGRPAVRVELLCRPGVASRLEELLLVETTTIGVRRREVLRRALARDVIRVTVLGHELSAKRVTLPDGRRRTKPEFADVQHVALATGRPLQDIFRLAAAEAERLKDA